MIRVSIHEELYVKSYIAGPYHKELDITIQGVLDSFAG